LNVRRSLPSTWSARISLIRPQRIAELCEMGDYTRDLYEQKGADLLIERNTLDVVPTSASLAIQRQRIEASSTTGRR
jgi:hypothetical protein